MSTVGSSFQETPKTKAVCACTDHNHGDVRKVIREQHLLTHREVYDFSKHESTKYRKIMYR